jgi:hypothetical protein
MISSVIASAAKQSIAQCKRSRDAVRTRVIVTCIKATKAFALRTDLRQRMPAVDAGRLTICVSSHEM